MGSKMCIDAQLTGKNTLAGFRQLFSFTGALFISMNNSYEYVARKATLAEVFENIDVFQTKLI